MQIRCDQMQERTWAKDPGTMPTYLSIQVLLPNSSGSGTRSWEGSGGGGGGEGRIKQQSATDHRGVIGPTQNQNIRSRVGQATTEQRDWQAHAKFRHETRQNASQRSHFSFQPNPCVQFFPGLSRLCPGLSGWLSGSWACQQLRQFPALHAVCPMFAFC